MRHTLRTLVAPVLLLAACGGQPPAPPAAQHEDDGAAGTSARLHDLVENYFDEALKLNPVAATFVGDHRYDDRMRPPTPEYRRASRALEQQALDNLKAIAPDTLSPEDRLTREVFDYGRRTALEGFAFPDHLLPLDSFNNPATFFAQMGSGESIQPFTSVRDYDNFAGRMALFPGWADQSIADMREGIARGVVLPAILVERMIPQLAEQAAATPEKSVFWQPIANMPRSFPAADRGRLTTLYRDLIGSEVIPAYRRLQEFTRDEYLLKARASVGLSSLPDGAKWYAYRARAYTTTDTPVEEIHEIGLREVARLDAEIARVSRQIGFKGSASALAESMRHDPRFVFRSADDLLNAYRGLQARVTAAVPRLFMLMPKSPLEIRPMEAFREQSEAAAEYFQPAADGSRPGIFYVNTYDLLSRPSYDIETTFLHEAIPGHHFQLALVVENTSLPRFRRLSADDAFSAHLPDITTAYSEGWGLYAESLGDELGMYEDPYQKLGNLFAESWRAARLVIDTGIHAKGWTRGQAIDYMLAHTAAGRTDATAEVERYIAWPGQALAYKIGQMTIRTLRTRAEQELGPRFDVRAFHAQVLDDGAMPLAVLEARIGRWIEMEKTAVPDSGSGVTPQPTATTVTE